MSVIHSAKIVQKCLGLQSLVASRTGGLTNERKEEAKETPKKISKETPTKGPTERKKDKIIKKRRPILEDQENTS